MFIDVTKGVVTYGIRAGSNRDLGFATGSVDMSMLVISVADRVNFVCATNIFYPAFVCTANICKINQIHQLLMFYLVSSATIYLGG